MIEGIDTPRNKKQIAIVVIGYNRMRSLERLLDSLNNAVYDYEDIPLVISIDCSNDKPTYKCALEFNWKHGEKYVNIQKNKLGLRDHIFQCFSLTRFFKGVILLEDDIFVSPYFYHFAVSSLDEYSENDNVAGIAFYTNEYNGFKNLPIHYYHNGLDVFASKSVCSWGEMMNERMWRQFSEWKERFDGDFSSYDMDNRIKNWNRAWSKYMYAFLLETDSYFIYPYEPLTTNFNDAGGEHGGGDNSVQVSLLQGRREYNYGSFSQLVKYDVYGNNLAIASWLGLEEKDLDVDFWGNRSFYNKRYILTPAKLSYKMVRGFRLTMRPWELNIKYMLEGNDIILYDRERYDVVIAPKWKYNDPFFMYNFRRFMPNMKLGFIARYYWTQLKKKIISIIGFM